MGLISLYSNTIVQVMSSWMLGCSDLLLEIFTWRFYVESTSLYRTHTWLVNETLVTLTLSIWGESTIRSSPTITSFEMIEQKHWYLTKAANVRHQGFISNEVIDGLCLFTTVNIVSVHNKPHYTFTLTQHDSNLGKDSHKIKHAYITNWVLIIFVENVPVL